MEAIKTDKRIKAFFKSIFKKKRYDPSECFPFEELPPELMFNVSRFYRFFKILRIIPCNAPF